MRFPLLTLLIGQCPLLKAYFFTGYLHGFFRFGIVFSLGIRATVNAPRFD